jgi:WD40 repeat protein
MEHPMPSDLGLGSLEFAPDGSRMVTAGVDGNARLWDPATGAELAVMSGHSGPVTAARFSPDGALIATGGTDGTVRLWDTATGTEELTVRDGGPSISSLAFTTGGRLAVLTASHTAEVYAIDIADLLSLARARVARSLADEECRLYLQQDGCPKEKP